MNVIDHYLEKCDHIIETIKNQKKEIEEAASLFASSILQDKVVHLFGSGHSRIMVEEMWPRYGSYPGFNPIVELSLSNHNLVVGANGQRQAMFLENVSGLADRILRNFNLDQQDTALIISSSGCNIVPIEMAEIFYNKGIKLVALISKAHSDASKSKRSDGKKLGDFAHIILDTGAPIGDAMIYVEGLDTPVSPGSTVGGTILVNCIKAELARILTANGKPPKVLTASAVVGDQRAKELFEGAYDEHGKILGRILTF